MKAETLTIIGLDRIGVSVGLALHEAKAELLVVGHDKEREVARKAQEMGAVDRVEWNLINAAAAADILVLSVPLAELENMLQVIGDDVKPHALVVDLAGLKGPALQWADKHLLRGHYVGASPVLAAAVLEDGGQTARADLFKQSVFCLAPSAKAESKAVETAVNLGLILGATPFFLDPYEFDSLVQGVEVAPGLLGAAMFRAVTQSPGWRDILRFAGRPFAQVTGLMDDADLASLAFHDQAATLRWLDAALEELKVVRRWVADGDAENLKLFLDDLLVQRDRWLKERVENDWDEKVETPDLSTMSIGSQLFGLGRLGDRLGGKDKKKKES
ncbi:MAG: prephenate dehydrogenase/arogenate dehydrogenase family protein [Chloroflexi bacterium]|nr:prephenate dehydrogenase/arogenate dehydrogenase family protein [Chloroflexota bacterium]MCI0647202.1 prephenate dehydrogenase/arogenate dehydrogenase family protein [Chloroflexota bacterium]MCI0728928.1 prephenate dehydrogenase/arogenate dehydrogenase family protein [Chloroflexota bacterium]